jgi:hypothetical protein
MRGLISSVTFTPRATNRMLTFRLICSDFATGA